MEFEINSMPLKQFRSEHETSRQTDRDETSTLHAFAHVGVTSGNPDPHASYRPKLVTTGIGKAAHRAVLDASTSPQRSDMRRLFQADSTSGRLGSPRTFRRWNELHNEVLVLWPCLLLFQLLLGSWPELVLFCVRLAVST